jgi:hypothetical protein
MSPGGRRALEGREQEGRLLLAERELLSVGRGDLDGARETGLVLRELVDEVGFHRSTRGRRPDDEDARISSPGTNVRPIIPWSPSMGNTEGDTRAPRSRTLVS